MQSQVEQGERMTKVLEKLEAREKGGSGSGSLVDTKGLGKPQAFNGNEAEFPGWTFKMEVWLAAQFGKDVTKWLDDARKHRNPITLDETELVSLQCARVSTHLYTALISLCSSGTEAMELVMNSEKGSGFDAWRRLCHRFHPDTPQTNMALLKKVMRPPQCTLENLLAGIERWERDHRLYRERTKEGLSDAMQRMCLHAMVPETMLDHLELNTASLTDYKKTKDEIERYCDARRAREIAGQNDGATPMDVDAINAALNAKCYNCGQIGHYAKDCPKPKKEYPGGVPGGQGKGKGKSKKDKGKGKGDDSKGKGKGKSKHKI